MDLAGKVTMNRALSMWKIAVRVIEELKLI